MKKKKLEIRIVIEDEREIAMVEKARRDVEKATGIKFKFTDKKAYISGIVNTSAAIQTA